MAGTSGTARLHRGGHRRAGHRSQEERQAARADVTRCQRARARWTMGCRCAAEEAASSTRESARLRH